MKVSWALRGGPAVSTAIREPVMPIVAAADADDPPPARRADEAPLLAQLGAGEEAAIREVYLRHHDTVRAFAQRLIGDREAAEDLVHEVFVALPRAARRFRGEASLRYFLFSIAVNHARQHLRTAVRRRRAQQRLMREPRPTSTTPGETVESRSSRGRWSRPWTSSPSTSGWRSCCARSRIARRARRRRSPAPPTPTYGRACSRRGARCATCSRGGRRKEAPREPGTRRRPPGTFGPRPAPRTGFHGDPTSRAARTRDGDGSIRGSVSRPTSAAPGPSGAGCRSAPCSWRSRSAAPPCGAPQPAGCSPRSGRPPRPSGAWSRPPLSHSASRRSTTLDGDVGSSDPRGRSALAPMLVAAATPEVAPAEPRADLWTSGAPARHSPAGCRPRGRHRPRRRAPAR